MFTLIIWGVCLLLTITVFLVVTFTRGNDWVDAIGPALGTAALCYFLSCLVVLCVWSSATEKHTEAIRYDLESLGITDPQYTGRMFLLSGSFEGEQRIQFFRADDDGALSLRWSTPDESRIFQDEDYEPYVNYINTVNTSPDWVLPWDSDPWVTHTTYDFHVPAGSVVNTYELDVSK